MAAGRKKEQRHPLRVHDETIPGGHCPVRAHPKSTTGRSGITIKPHLVPIPNQSGTVYNKKTTSPCDRGFYLLYFIISVMNIVPNTIAAVCWSVILNNTHTLLFVFDSSVHASDV